MIFAIVFARVCTIETFVSYRAFRKNIIQALFFLDFQDFCLRFSKENYLCRPLSRDSASFPRGPLLGGLLPISLCDRPTPG